MVNGQSRVFDRLVHRLRKIDVTFLEGRTTVLKIDKERKIHARDEGVMLLGRLCDYIKSSQEAILTALGDDNRDIFELSPLYQNPEPAAPAEGTTEGQCPACCCHDNEFKNNSRGAAMFVTDPLL